MLFADLYNESIDDKINLMGVSLFMGMTYEHEMPIDFGTDKQPIIRDVPDYIFEDLGYMYKNSRLEVNEHKDFAELSIWLEKALIKYPAYFTEELVKTILSAHAEKIGTLA